MKNKLTTIWHKWGGKVCVLFISLFFASNLALAQGGTPTNIVIKNPIAANDFASFLETILNIVVEIGLPIVVIAIIFVGFKFVTAQGKPAAIEEAKKSFYYVIIGAAIVLGCKVIVVIIQSTVETIK